MIAAGDTGSQVLTTLARMNNELIALNHPGLTITLFDDDKVESVNLARQSFITAELGLHKPVAVNNHIARFFGINRQAKTERYDKYYCRLFRK